MNNFSVLRFFLLILDKEITFYIDDIIIISYIKNEFVQEMGLLSNYCVHLSIKDKTIISYRKENYRSREVFIPNDFNVLEYSDMELSILFGKEFLDESILYEEDFAQISKSFKDTIK